MVYLNPDTEALDLARALEEVSGQRRSLAMRYLRDSDRRLSLAVYLLLRRALREEYGVDGPLVFDYGANGKPFLREYPHIHFNLSHCPGVALCVVDDAPVGCDVERVPSALDLDLCRQVCSAAELAEILADPTPEIAFTRCWTQKEAFLKYTGEGLTDRLKALLDTPAAKAVRFESVPAPDGSYVYTVCRKGNYPYLCEDDRN